MKEIILTQGQRALVDDADFDWLSQWNWRAQYCKNGPFYAARTVHGGASFTVLMHRVITGAPSGMEVDHINGDKLDNQRKNLRICSKSQNLGNQKIRSSNRSGFKGVSFSTSGARTPGWGRWKAKVKGIHLGYFSTAEEAALAYNTAAKQHFGEFAKPNVLIGG